jgi:hypothetical protein
MRARLAGAALDGRGGGCILRLQALTSPRWQWRRTSFDNTITYVYFESPGTAHEWLTWRRSLHDFAPRLFK